MGESFDHPPPGRIRQSGKCCPQSIHNHMVVDYLADVKGETPDSLLFRDLSVARVGRVALAGSGDHTARGSRPETIKGKRDLALLAILVACGSEAEVSPERNRSVRW